MTPPWYQMEMIRQVEADQFSLNTKALIDKGSVFFKSAVTKALSYKHPWLAAAIMSREWEYWHKVGGQIEAWSDNWQSLSGDRRIEGLPWSQFDLDALRLDSDKRQHELCSALILYWCIVRSVSSIVARRPTLCSCSRESASR